MPPNTELASADDASAVGTVTDLTLILPDRVGSLAETMAVFGRAGLSIHGHGGFPAWAGEGVLHLVVDEPERAVEALRQAGIAVREERAVLVVRVHDQPGGFADVLNRIAAAGINIDLTYSLADGRIVLGVNDMARARTALTR